MLFVFGFASFDTYNLFKNGETDMTSGEYFVSAFLACLFLVCFFSLIMVAIKYRKSIMILNVFYGLNILLFFGAFLINEFDNLKEVSFSDRLIMLALICIPGCLIFLINKFKQKEINYENIDEIGKLE